MGRHDDDAAGFWDAHYQRHAHIWTGAPNAVLVTETTDLRPRLALELGCGEGADAVWLAQRGWRVVAVDVSTVALSRAASHAAAAGVADRIVWEQHDLDRSFPAGSFDLVTAHYLHAAGSERRAVALRRAAGAVSSGGCLLVVGHASVAPWSWDRHADLPTARQVLDSLVLDEHAWSIEVCEDRRRPATGPNGEVASVTDSVVRLTRTGERGRSPLPGRRCATCS